MSLGFRETKSNSFIMNDSKFKTIGSKSILTIKLDINNDENAKMLSFFNDLDAARLDSEKKSFFGDQSYNDASLHLRSEFQCLTLLVEYNVRRYMDQCGYNCENLAFFHQKAWPVITHSGGKVNSHGHPNSDLSVVYYLQCEWGCGGSLVFNSGDDLIKPGFIKGNPIRGLVERSMYGLKPIPGLLVIFPSNLNHYVSEYSGSLPRYSITYDISLAASASLGTGDSENFVVHPSFWREFSAKKSSTMPNLAPQPIAGRGSRVCGHDTQTRSVSDSFNEQGFYRQDSFLSSSMCTALLGEIIDSWTEGHLSHIKSPKFRLHSPLLVADTSLLLLRKICSSYRQLLADYLTDSKAHYLVDLSSITSFPGAVEQKLHRDNSHPEKRFITFFINLFTADSEDDSLMIAPGTHKSTSISLANQNLFSLELTQGTLVAVNNSLIHAGGSNTSHSSMRPVWYCSFGHNIEGLTYNIRDEYVGKYTYLDFIDY